MDQCIRRDEAWKEYYTTEMDKLSSSDIGHPLIDIFEKERKADIELLKNNFNKASIIYHDISLSIDPSNLDYGWYLQEEAKYKWFYNKTDSAYIQKKAYENNSSNNIQENRNT